MDTLLFRSYDAQSNFSNLLKTDTITCKNVVFTSDTGWCDSVYNPFQYITRGVNWEIELSGNGKVFRLSNDSYPNPTITWMEYESCMSGRVFVQTMNSIAIDGVQTGVSTLSDNRVIIYLQ